MSLWAPPQKERIKMVNQKQLNSVIKNEVDSLRQQPASFKQG